MLESILVSIGLLYAGTTFTLALGNSNRKQAYSSKSARWGVFAHNLNREQEGQAAVIPAEELNRAGSGWQLVPTLQ